MKKLLLLALLPLLSAGLARAEDNTATCPAGADALGVSRVAEIDTTGGPLFGDQYPPAAISCKRAKSSSPSTMARIRTTRRQILAALAAQCTKATFFNVGEMVKQFPDVAREVQAAGPHDRHAHLVASQSRRALAGKRQAADREHHQRPRKRCWPNGVAPFFRFPYLSDPKRVREYLASRNIAVFSIDVDFLDYRMRSPEKFVDNVLKGLQKTGGGIILFHDIHAVTAKALPTVLEELKSHGYPRRAYWCRSRASKSSPLPRSRRRPRRACAYRHHRHARHR